MAAQGIVTKAERAARTALACGAMFLASAVADQAEAQTAATNPLSACLSALGVQNSTQTPEQAAITALQAALQTAELGGGSVHLPDFLWHDLWRRVRRLAGAHQPVHLHLHQRRQYRRVASGAEQLRKCHR